MARVARTRLALADIELPIWRILLHSLLFGLALSIADLLFNFYLVSLGYGADTAGLLSTVGRAAGMLMGVPIGLLIDRLGSQRSMLVGIALYAGGYTLLIQATALPALIAAQFVVGVGYLLASTAVTPLLIGVTPDRLRATVLGMNASATLIIGLAGSALGGMLPGLAVALAGVAAQSTAAYRLALGVVIALSLVALLPLLGALRALPEPRPAGAGVDVPEQRLPLTRLLRFALPALLLGVGGGCILPFQNLFFRDVFGLDDAAVGLTLAAAALGAGLGALLGAPITARIGLRRGAALLRLGALPAMLLMLAPALLPAAAGFFLRGLFIAASYPMNDALVMRATPPRQRGVAMSAMSVLWSGGWAASAAVAGWVRTETGSFVPIIVTAAVCYVLSALSIATMPVSDEAAA